MHRKGIGIILLMTVELIASVHSFARSNPPDTADFVHVKSSGDIDLYERWYYLNADQRAREIKATLMIRTEPYAAAALIKDESRGRAWNPNVKTYRVVPGDEMSWVSYIEYNLPWPVSNQDCVLQYTLRDCGESFEINFRNTEHPMFPPQKRVERIPDIRGKWILTSSDKGILVEYYITTTPSSTLPSWLTDPIIRNNLLETMASFRKILEGSGRSRHSSLR